MTVIRRKVWKITVVKQAEYLSVRCQESHGDNTTEIHNLKNIVTGKYYQFLTRLRTFRFINFFITRIPFVYFCSFFSFSAGWGYTATELPSELHGGPSACGWQHWSWIGYSLWCFQIKEQNSFQSKQPIFYLRWVLLSNITFT